MELKDFIDAALIGVLVALTVVLVLVAKILW